jgi:cytoskeletal protein RodZ
MTTEQNTNSTIMDLKTARENSGLTLKELFERTRISVVNLEAMENGNFNLLPVPIYTRNFIKIYSETLGVDSKPLLQRYEDYLQALQIKEKEKISEQPPRAPLITTLSRYKTCIWVVLFIIIIAAVSFFASTYNKPASESSLKTEAPKEAATSETRAQDLARQDNLPIVLDLQKPENLITVNPSGDGQKQAQQRPVQMLIPGNAAASVTPETSKTKVEARVGNEEQFVLMIHATEETWIRMQIDDREPYQVLLDPGEKISHKASRFNMDIGNAGGIRIQFDGKTIENLGKSGQVIHLRLP